MNMHKILLFSLILSVVIVVGCSQGKQTSTLQQTPITEEAVTPTGEVKEITVKGSEFRFEPAAITVNKGDRVKITFENVGGISHNLNINGYGGTRAIIRAGSSDTIEFVADKTGTFDLWCTVPGHRSSGMEGSFVVR